MELLLYLAERPDQVVTRQEIEDNVWQGRIVGYDALSGCIAKIRRAFEDSSKHPRIIKTISKAGYQLIAPVLVEPVEQESFPEPIAGKNFERKLTAVFYADVAGYSRLTGEDEDRTHRQLRENMKSISDSIVRFRGRIIHYAGDAVLADFSTASMALHCALDAQQRIAKINAHLAEDQRVLFRIGVNMGEVIVDGDEIYGDGVNVAARLESLAEAGGVCISGTMFDAIGQKQLFDFEYHGEKTVKNIHHPVRTYAVQLKPGASIPAPDSTAAARHSAHPWLKYKQPPVLVSIALVTVLALFIGYIVFGTNDPAQPAKPILSPDALSIAVLPFLNTSNDPGQSVYAAGLTDGLIADLSNLDGLQVAPRYLSGQGDASKSSILDIAKALQVRYIVQGSQRRSLADVRVNIQLLDTVKNQQIWAQQYDDKIENIFLLKDKILAGILERIKFKPRNKPVSKRKTNNIEAYDNFLRAEHRRLNNRDYDDIAETIRFYLRAIELDPMFVAAYTGLAREALINYQLDSSQVMPAAASKKMVYEAVQKALEIDPENAEAYAILGLLQSITGSHNTGIASVRTAVAYNPSNPQLHADLATVLSHGGNHREALESINRAIDRHTTAPAAFIGERARIYFFLRQFKNALEDANSVQDIREFKNFSLFINGALNDPESAQPFVKKRLDNIPWENLEYYRVIFAYYRRPQDIDLIVESASKAGMPRFAYGFDPGDSKPLDDNSIRDLTHKGLWQGSNHGSGEFFQQFMANNGVALRTDDSMMSGSYHIENSQLCVSFRSVLLGLPDCGYIYPADSQNDYSWVTLGDVYRFSIEK